MNLDQLSQSIELDQKKLCRQRLIHTLPWFSAVVIILGSIFYLKDKSLTWGGFDTEYLNVGLIALIPFVIGLTFRFITYLTARKQLADYRDISGQLELAEKGSSIILIQNTISFAEKKANKNSLVKAILEPHLSLLNYRVGELRQFQLREQLDSELAAFNKNYSKKLETKKNEVPLIKAKANIRASLEFLKQRREEILTQWQQSYEAFSWWNKIKYDGVTPDFSEMDKVVSELERMNTQLSTKHCDDFKRIDAHFDALKVKACTRVSNATADVELFIKECGHQKGLDSDLLRKSIWLSALSLPVSMWTDAERAGDVFDALRSVNGNYSNMSDSEIWWETLFLPAESLAGLAALTKGAYFEQLVAADTGGELFEHFNNPNTDIVIDGIAFQLKATDSSSYVNGVSEDIPVIATSEVALATGVIDSGYSNEELTNTVDLTLGGTVVDVGDSVADAILTGVGGLGFFATIEGINHAAKKHENGGDGVEAMFEGAGVAIEGTARALVGTAELGYKALMSRPSRYVGRKIKNGLIKLDEKMMEESGKS